MAPPKGGNTPPINTAQSDPTVALLRDIKSEMQRGNLIRKNELQDVVNTNALKTLSNALGPVLKMADAILKMVTMLIMPFTNLLLPLLLPLLYFLTPIVKFLNLLMRPLYNDLMTYIKNNKGAIESLVTGGLSGSGIGDMLSGLLDTITGIGSKIITTLTPLITDGINWLVAAVKSIDWDKLITQLGKLLSDGIGGLETLTKPIIDAVWPKVENILKGWGIPTSLDDIVNDVKGFLSTILTPIAGLVEGALGFITDMKTTILNVISNLVMTIFDVMNDIDAAITDFRVVMVYAQAAIAGITAFLSNFSIMDLGASARKAAANASVVDVAQIAALDSGYISRVSSRGITEDSISTAIGEFNKSSNQMIDSIQSLTDAIKAGLNGTLTISNGQGTMSQHTINSRGSGVVSSANIQGSS